METSIIIRVKNEVVALRKLLGVLQTQTYQDFEVIVVNDNSADGSEVCVYDFLNKDRASVITLEKPFNYAYASNVGAEAAKGKYLVYLSAHSLPISNTWLLDGLKHFADKKVLGVYAMPLALPDTNLIEKLFINIPTYLFHSQIKNYSKPKLGVMGATNAIFRKDLWQQHPFDEANVLGGEDSAWAAHFLGKGYFAVHDPRFRVYHSHRLGLTALLRQAIKYHRMMAASTK